MAARPVHQAKLSGSAFDPIGAPEMRKVVGKWIQTNLGDLKSVSMGLPEIDDRYDLWKVPIVVQNHRDRLAGEVSLDRLGKVKAHTDLKLLRMRITRLQRLRSHKAKGRTNGEFRPAAVPNQVILGDAIRVLEELPPDTAQLVVTSPPYFNAKPQYSEYLDYQEYLDFIRKVMVRVHDILSEGRFIIVVASPVLVRRTARSTASKRIPIPFDLHRILESVGFEYVDDIIWEKPEGAGWNTGRGRRFAADRQPLQYKPVPVTEILLVYRKVTDRLIDWNIRAHHDQRAVKESNISGDYDVTNVWRIAPAHHKVHPAAFPDDLVERLIRYYSFKGDMVLDPFAGSGTVGRVAQRMGRRFLLVDNDPRYFRVMKDELSRTAGSRRVDFETHESSGPAGAHDAS